MAMVESAANTQPDGLGSFHNLQATFSSTRRARPPPMNLPTPEDEQRVPLKASKLNRRDSKGGLRSMFTRNKVDKVLVSPVQEEPLKTGISEQSMRPETVVSLRRSASMNRTPTIPDTIPSTPAKSINKTSRMNLRTRSVKQTKSAATTSKATSKGSPKPTNPKLPTRTSAAWDPPPLFQAYPQAIKHAHLSASTLSADSILRISNHRRNNSLRDDFAQTGGSNDRPDQTTASKKSEKAKHKHRRQISGSISKADWTQKIFVLVTSGYFLQYSGEGSFDRLPEKMMQLGKDSVAFASDVIPGKHWVLQVSQAMDSDGVPAADSRSLLSRLAFRNADYRRTATSLLLVLNSAEDMDAWIAVVRREIEALGGKKNVSETGKPKPDNKVMQLRAQPSHRYLVQRNPDQFSSPSSPTNPSFGTPSWNPDDELQAKLEDAASFIRPVSSCTRPLTGHQSIANSTISHDDRQLDNLRDSNRLSYMSSGQRTLITSQGSSATSSPTRESVSTLDDFPPKISTEDIRPRPNAYAINERRRSMQTLQTSLVESQPKPYRPHSVIAPSRPTRPYSPPITPNFSVPTCSSKRFSKPPVISPPPIPTIVTTTPSKSMLKGTRKAPPAALNVNRPLSPVHDSPSLSKGAPPVFTPTGSSFRRIEQVKASVVDIPPRSPTSPISSSPQLELPRRFSSLMPLNSAETAHLDFQFPRRHSSMMALREAVDELLEKPPSLAPLPPAALTVPLPPSPLLMTSDEATLEARAEADTETISPLPAMTPQKSLRRPASMQIQPTNNSPSTLSPALTTKSARSPRMISPNRPSPSAASSETLNRGFASPASTSLRSPFQKGKGLASPQGVGLANRKSMPMLVNGPPPAPPPNCALPPLPPPNGMMKSPPSSMRNSVRV